jgi:hypothetical protein
MKHNPVPTHCERCDRPVNDRTGWGVMMTCAIQPQPAVSEADAEEREQSMLMCGYCFHELARWVDPNVDLGDQRA